MEKRDPYKSKEGLQSWLDRLEIDALNGLSKKNGETLVQFIKDFSIGLNVSKMSIKGGRSPIRLNHLRQKIAFIMRKMQDRGVKHITDVAEEQVHTFFSDMWTGKLPNKYGKPYLSTGDYVKDFKTFWHWHQKIQKKKGKIIPDISEELSTRGKKPKFVYFTKEDFENMIQKASPDLKLIMVVAFFTGARPTEILNLKVSDFSNDFKEVEIRGETSKTFGRKFSMPFGHEQIKEYVSRLGLERNEYIARLDPSRINKELRKIGKEVLKKEQIEFKNLTLMDFRHSSTCFWLNRYKSESKLKYRFGWKKSDKVFYYSEFKGMVDDIKEEDLYTDITKTELEKELLAHKNELDKLKKELHTTVPQLVNSLKTMESGFKAFTDLILTNGEKDFMERTKDIDREILRKALLQSIKI